MKNRGNLVLTRKKGESVTIGDSVVTVTKIRIGTREFDHAQVVLAIEADRDLPVHRSEISSEAKAKLEARSGPAGLKSNEQTDSRLVGPGNRKSHTSDSGANEERNSTVAVNKYTGCFGVGALVNGSKVKAKGND